MTSDREVRLVRGRLPESVACDTAAVRVLLQRVAAGEHPETLRVYTPPRTVAFGRQDVRGPRFPAAVAAARDHGFEVVRRFAGARSVALHEGVLAFEQVVADPAAQMHFQQRLVEAAGCVAQALRDVGVDARVGDVFQEYAPGAYSVNARGAVKLASFEQRLVPGGSLVTGSVVVTGAGLIREVLSAVNGRLGFEFRPTTVAAVEDEIEDATVSRVRDAFLDELRSRDIRFVDGRLDPAVVTAARALEPEHDITG